MGATQSSSSNASGDKQVQQEEGAHYAKIVAPQTFKKKLQQNIEKGRASSAGEKKEGGGGNVEASNGDKNLVRLDLRAKVIKSISYELLWDNFLGSTATSFALSSSDTIALLSESYCQDAVGPDGMPLPPVPPPVIEQEVAAYIELLNDKSGAPVKVFDLMAICSSAMLLSAIPIEKKIDQLFSWIVLDPNRESFTFEDMYVALASFEKGLAFALGEHPASEAYIRAITAKWMTEADPHHRDCSRNNVEITARQFFDLCTNRQNTVRRLLEALGSSVMKQNKSHDLVEVVNSDLEKAPTGGDEFMANPAWKKTAEKMVPKGTVINPTKPQSSLTLEWVHGYRGFDCRNNVRYVSKIGSQISFTAAALSIVQDNTSTATSGRTQSYFGEHGDDIICHAIYEPADPSNWSEIRIATGEIGKSPAIHLYSWKPAPTGTGGQFQSLACMRGYHTKGVCQLEFSGDGKLLFSVGVEYTVAIYNTTHGSSSFGKMVGSSQGPKSSIFHASRSGDKDFFTCGEKHACLWKVTDPGIPKCENVKTGEHKNKMFLSAARVKGGLVVTGTAEGDLITFKGIDLVPTRVQKEALGKNVAVNAIYATPSGDRLITGGRTGEVIIWEVPDDPSKKMERLSSFKIKGFSLSENIFKDGVPDPKLVDKATPALRSVAMSADMKKIVVGTLSCEIIEFTMKDAPGKTFADAAGTLEINANSLVVGHFKDELWGLATRPPSQPGTPQTEYCTVGDDGFLRIWSVQERRQLKCLNLEGMARCVAYSPNGQFIAVGFGGSVGKGNKNPEDGKIVVYRSDDFSVLSEIREAKQWISVLKFSPDGATLAVGSRDCSIYLYSVAQQFKRKAKFSKHSAGINQLDFSTCGKVLQSCCSAYEILFSDTSTGTQLTNGVSTLVDTQWDTWTLTLGWCTNGIWKGDMDGGDINAVERSPSSKLLASSDDFGKVNIFRYPCVTEGSQKNEYAGHSSHVTCVRWLTQYTAGPSKPTDDYLISTGGGDKCVFQWRNSGQEGNVRLNSSALEALAAEEAMKQDSTHDHETNALDEAPTGGDEFTAVKPWLGAIVTPSAWAKPDPAKLGQLDAALGEFGSKQRLLGSKEDGGTRSKGMTPDKVLKIYEEAENRAKTVFNKLCESGISNSSAPDCDELELEWVHGYRGYDCRNNMRYFVEGGVRYVVYHAAALGIVFDPVHRKQSYFKGHTDDIMSLAVYTPPSGPTVVATGQQAKANTFVWEASSKKSLAVIQTQQKSINMLEFSRDGRLLVSIAEDKTIAVSDWKSQNVIINTKGEGAVTYHIASSSIATNFNFLSCGDKHIKFWTLNGRNLGGNKVSTSGCKGVSPMAFLCTAEVKGKFVVGCEDGWILVIPDTKAVRSRFDHNGNKDKADRDKLGKAGGSVTAIFADDSRNILISGAKDGSVCVWDTSGLNDKQDIPTLKYSFMLAAPTAPDAPAPAGTVFVKDLMAKQIQSVCSLPSNVKMSGLLIAVSTRGCDAVEVLCPEDGSAPHLRTERKGDGFIVRGHCNDELWGIATHPVKPEYCTVGDDKTLRFFSIESKTMLAAVPLGNISRTVAYHPEGNIIAAGFGGRVGKGKEGGDGMVRLYTSDPASPKGIIKLAERTDAKQWISDVKFSADGRTLCVGAHDCKIYIYNVINKNKDPSSSELNFGLELRCTFGKHASVINHLDLSADGRFMQSNCSAFELLFSDTTTGKQITSASELKDVKWDTWTCTFGWPVQGIWPAGADGLDINGVARSRSGHLLATSDHAGKIKVFRYPVIKEQQASLSYSGHSSHVTCCRWSAGDECLLSTGGNDKCVMQWRHYMSDAGRGSNTKSGAYDEDDEATDLHEGIHDILPASSHAHSHSSAESLLLDGPSGGDESGCVKPWLGAVKTPKNPPPVNSSAPPVNMKLKWVHGYTSATSGAGNVRVSNNLMYNSECDPVFPAAALGVKLHRDLNNPSTPYTQTYFGGHNDDILCLTISKDRRFVATGQTASKTSKGKGNICIWDAVDCRLLSRMDGCHQRAVVSLAFNSEGNQLVSVGQDDKNTHTLWTDAGGGWSRAQQSATMNSDQNAILFTKWVHPQNEWYEKGEYHFVSGGAQAIHFWKIEGATLTKKAGRFGKKYKQCPPLCAANINTKDGWRIVCGTATGDFYLFKEREVDNGVEKAHNAAVLCLTPTADGLNLISGGKDKTVRVWNNALQPISSFDLASFSIVDASVGSIDIRPPEPGGKKDAPLTILAGTYGGEVIEITASGSGGNGNASMELAGARPTVLLYSHFNGELWGLATHPTDADIVATVGDDSTLRLWSVSKNKQISVVNIGWPARCVTFHPSGSLLAVGLFELTKGGLGGGSGGKKAPPQKGGKAAASAGSANGEDAQSGPGGSVMLFSIHNRDDGNIELKKRAVGCPSVAWINDVKFSPLGHKLVAGSHDKKLYSFGLPRDLPSNIDADDWGSEWTDCLKTLKPSKPFDKHSSAVLHIDFSLDGLYIQTNCQAAELLFSDAESLKQETSATKMAEYTGQLEDAAPARVWATQTCKLGWGVQGIWPPGADTSDINSVDKHCAGKLLASADDNGQVKIFRYPCVNEGAKYISLDGHSSHVTCVRWTVGNTLASVGGNDKCLFIWDMEEK